MVLKTVETSSFTIENYSTQMTKLFKKHGITKDNLVNITPLGSTIFITFDDKEEKD